MRTNANFLLHQKKQEAGIAMKYLICILDGATNISKNCLAALKKLSFGEVSEINISFVLVLSQFQSELL